MDENAKPCFMDTNSFIVHVKTENICKNIAEDVETIFGTSKIKFDRPLPKVKNKKIFEIMKDDLSLEVMKELFGLRAKTYSELIKNSDEDKKAKGTQKSVS